MTIARFLVGGACLAIVVHERTVRKHFKSEAEKWKSEYDFMKLKCENMHSLYANTIRDIETQYENTKNTILDMKHKNENANENADKNGKRISYFGKCDEK